MKKILPLLWPLLFVAACVLFFARHDLTKITLAWWVFGLVVGWEGARLYDILFPRRTR
jgi:hypothetical protein